MDCNSLWIILLLLFINTRSVYSTPDGEAVGSWADKFGSELWDLGSSITKISEIKSSYQHLNTQVKKKDPTNLLLEIVENVGRMLEKKMDAIKCILLAAEDAAEKYNYNETEPEYPYYSATHSEIDENNCTENIFENENNTIEFKPMCLKTDPHFYNIPVNTSHSVVHVPANVYDKLKDARMAIEWTERLDDIFVQNYNADPALSWQYFGSTTGIMRQYPAMKWKWKEDDVDLYDCRSKSWFIEAATCSKDVIILFDHSGSMAGMPNHIAKLTVASILDTFSNNDYVKIFNYSKTTDELVPCFKDILVQATPENVKVFKDALEDLPATGGYADLAVAFEKSFELLEIYREKRGCIDNDTECNQAIMLVTDGVPGNLTEVFEKYNWLNNGTHIPVRIFTFLIGREVTKVREIQWMACLNRGYYSHVKSLEEVTEKVFNYIPVIARPLVLQGTERPISWTHAFADTRNKNDTEYRFQEYHLFTSVAIPAFDTKMNSMNNNDTRIANLLGVAGTDVPLDDFKKLAFPYKIGVNGYALLVSTNGYVLMHPDLRPVFNGVLKENYNSIDLVEIEQVDDDLGPRELNPRLLELREALVNGSEGTIKNINLKYHYDEMRRVSLQTYHFYFAPLKNTPFSIGLAIPKKYGENLISVGDEIRKNRHTNIKISSFFKGSNWRIHPKWVYCKYHYQDRHQFKSAEEELVEFLEKMTSSNWKWYPQYEEHKKFYETNMDDEYDECNKDPLSPDAYYCDKELIQQLVFDAKATNMENWKFRSKESKNLFKRFGANLRFVATMSGLTRWEYVFGDRGNNTEPEFGDIYSRTIDEIWYKSAVLQPKIVPETFVYSVPFDAGSRNEEVMVTGSYAINIQESGNRVPASVVGYQLSHSHMYERFMEITQKNNCQGCIESCNDYEIDCYVVDHNGYIIISEIMNDTGRFFGEIDGAVMDAMLQEQIFEKVTIYDYQALCFRVVMVSSDSNILATPLRYVTLTINWILSKIVWLLIETNLSQFLNEHWVLSCITPEMEEKAAKRDKSQRKLRKGQNKEEEDFFNQIREPVFENQPYPCEKQRDLYILQQHLFTQGNDYPGKVPTNCSRPFYVKRIPHSNMLLIVIKALFPSCYVKIDNKPTDIVYTDVNNTEHPCQKLGLNNLPRRRLSGCFNEHPLEHEIKMCGDGIINSPDLLFILFTCVITFILIL